MTFIHELADWPDLNWDSASLGVPLASTRHEQGLLIGRMSALSVELRRESSLVTLTDEVVQSSAIEGEVLDRREVRSSIARRIGVAVRPGVGAAGMHCWQAADSVFAPGMLSGVAQSTLKTQTLWLRSVPGTGASSGASTSSFLRVKP